MAIDRPLEDPETPFKIYLNFIAEILTIIFAIEALIKIIALGFYWNGSKSYLKNGWNRLDFSIVLLTLAQMNPA